MSNQLAPLSPVEVKAADLVRLAQFDLDWFAAICLPQMKLYKFPPFYHAAWKLMINALLQGKIKQDNRYGLGIPRGFIKTTLFKLLVAWAVAYSRFQFIVVFQATDAQAQNFLADVGDILDGPNFISLYGNWREQLSKDTLDTKVTHYQGRNLILRALGKGTAARGINMKHSRPDLMVFDDVQSKEESESLVEWATLKNWLDSTIEYLQDPSGCVRLAAGNMYPHENCFMRRLENSSRWKTFIVGAINDQGESLWEELHPIERLLDQYRAAQENGSEDQFRAELLNDRDVTSLSTLQLHKTKSEDELLQDLAPIAGFIIIDPSGSKDTSDNTEIGAFYVYEDDVILCHKFVSGRFTPEQTISKSLDLATEYGLTVIGVEDVAYQSTLSFWFNKTLTDLGAQDYFKVLMISPEGQAKNARILTALRQWERGQLVACGQAYQQLLTQARSFKPSTKKNIDDKLDVFAYAPRFWAKYSRQIPEPTMYQQLYTPELQHQAPARFSLPAY